MNKYDQSTMRTIVISMLLLCGIGLINFGSAEAQDTTAAAAPLRTIGTMNLGEFSVSLAVQDLNTSKVFYERLGFVQIGGDIEQNWLVMQNGTATIGLFQGMFEGNLLTFNPTDVRTIQRSLKEKGIAIVTEADESTEGPAHIVVKDPDGNIILLDQF